MDWQVVLAAAGGIVLIGNAAALIYKWLRPAYQLTQRVKVLEEHDRKDYETIEALRELSKAQCSALLSIINHMIDGNNKEDMKKTREQIARSHIDEITEVDKMKVKSDTIARTIVLMITLLNLVLGLLGKTALKIDESVIYEACSVGAVIVAAVISWWKNNSFTQAALKADEVMKSEKALKAANK